MSKSKELGSFLLVIAICSLLFVVDTKCKRSTFEKLRNKELTTHIKGEITGITSARKSSMLVYSYSYRIGSQEYKGIYTMIEKYQGITVGSPVGVIYLNEDPITSRIIFTDEDFNWINN